MSSTRTKKSRGLNCPVCVGVRLFTEAARDTDDGRRVRCRRCSVCDHAIDYPLGEAPGLTCPGCGDVRCPAKYTRHRRNATFRVRECVSCECRFRTVERIEARIG